MILVERNIHGYRRALEWASTDKDPFSATNALAGIFGIPEQQVKRDLMNLIEFDLDEASNA